MTAQNTPADQPTTFSDCFPGSEKIWREVEHDGETLRVPFRRIHLARNRTGQDTIARGTDADLAASRIPDDIHDRRQMSEGLLIS